MVNPAKLFRFKKELTAFTERHPKFIRYVNYVQKEYVKEGSVIDVTVTDPDDKALHANLRLSAEDVAMLAELKDFLGMI